MGCCSAGKHSKLNMITRSHNNNRPPRVCYRCSKKTPCKCENLSKKVKTSSTATGNKKRKFDDGLHNSESLKDRNKDLGDANKEIEVLKDRNKDLDDANKEIKVLKDRNKDLAQLNNRQFRDLDGANKEIATLKTKLAFQIADGKYFTTLIIQLEQQLSNAIRQNQNLEVRGQHYRYSYPGL